MSYDSQQEAPLAPQQRNNAATGQCQFSNDNVKRNDRDILECEGDASYHLSHKESNYQPDILYCTSGQSENCHCRKEKKRIDSRLFPIHRYSPFRLPLIPKPDAVSRRKEILDIIVSTNF